MAKQKIVIKVQMASDRCRSRALALVAATGGVDSVALAGDGKDQVVVVGEGVDSIKLTSALRKKVGGAELVQVGEDKKEEKKPAPAPTVAAPEYYSQWYYHPYPPPPPPHLAGAVYDHHAAGYGYYPRSDTCSIM
ncbi:hypothetical protein PAHAL_1G284900 [Panicum hallii]|uniref:HMA domain-containing protein n=1 Tax=Panicum hallii TaxID=206008 RepID=A0A2S3GQF2_9POAL|nr:heavy metal-associated isoprenylated plant protein 47-like [Panicum hallii]PAN06739.1 hypothetical protein PAHAL_1G284900 [Panicum hallii]